MGDQLLGTNAWLSAVKNVVESYGVAVALAVGEFARQGKLTGPAGIGVVDGNNPSEVAEKTAIYVAQQLNVLPYDGADAAARQQLAELRMRVRRAVFHDEKDVVHEFGSRYPQPSTARYKDATRENVYGINSSPEGRLLEKQLNHLVRAVSAFHYASLRDLSNLIGKATTGASPNGSGNVHVYLGLKA